MRKVLLSLTVVTLTLSAHAQVVELDMSQATGTTRLTGANPTTATLAPGYQSSTYSVQFFKRATTADAWTATGDTIFANDASMVIGTGGVLTGTAAVKVGGVDVTHALQFARSRDIYLKLGSTSAKRIVLVGSPANQSQALLGARFAVTTGNPTLYNGNSLGSNEATYTNSNGFVVKNWSENFPLIDNSTAMNVLSFDGSSINDGTVVKHFDNGTKILLNQVVLSVGQGNNGVNWANTSANNIMIDGFSAAKGQTLVLGSAHTNIFRVHKIIIVPMGYDVPVTSLKILNTPPTAPYKTGSKIQLTAKAEPLYGDYEWSITQGADKATISAGGLLTATGAGRVKVKVSGKGSAANISDEMEFDLVVDNDIVLPFEGNDNFIPYASCCEFDAATKVVQFTGCYCGGFGWYIQPNLSIAEFHSVQVDFASPVESDNIEVKYGLNEDRWFFVPRGSTSVTVPFDKNYGSLLNKVYLFNTRCESDKPSVTLKSVKLLGTGVPASNDATLSDLKLNVGTLSPAFDPAVTSYTATVIGEPVIEFTPTTNHENAEVYGDGRKALINGNNTFYIEVTAENGVTQKIYTVRVTASAVPDITIVKEDLPFRDDASYYEMTASPKSITFGGPTWMSGVDWEFDPQIWAADYPAIVFVMEMDETKAVANTNFFAENKKSIIIGEGGLNGLTEFRYELDADNPVSKISIREQDWEGLNTYPFTITFTEAYLEKKVYGTVAVPSHSISALQIYPNPAKDYIKVSGLQTGETLRILDLSGRVLLVKEVTKETENIAINNLSAGMYLLKTGNTVAKIIKN